jgi:hypothetical protein
MDHATTPESASRQLTPDELDDVVAGFEIAVYNVVDRGDGTWAVANQDGTVAGVYPNRGMAVELALYLNNPTSNPRPAWWS